jgi:uncharacterized repeat protein (TIGR01451 family)
MMKPIRGWMVGGVVMAALVAAAWGTVALGQPEPPAPRLDPVPLVPTVPPAVPPAAPTKPAVTPPAAPPQTLPGVKPGELEPIPLPPSIGKTEPMAPVKTEPTKTDLPMPTGNEPPLLTIPSLSATPPPAAPTRPAGNEVRIGRQEPAVSIEWSGPPMVRLNQPMTCQLFVKNTCGVAVNNVVVRHRPSQGVTYRASEPQPSVDQGDLLWSLGTLAAGQVRKIELQMVVQVKGPLTCQATVTFSGAAAHQVQVSEPQLQVKMKGPERVLAGEPVTLLYTVSNPGDGPAESVKLKTLLPEGLEHQHGKAIEVALGTLTAKETRTLQLVCTAKGSGVQKCQAIVLAEGGLHATDELALDLILPKLDLVVNGPKLRYIDRKASYTLKVTNPSSAVATNVVVHGVTPISFKYQAASSGGVFDEGTRAATWVIGDLQPGQSREVSLDVIPSAPGDHRITAQVSSARGLKTDAEARTVVEGLPALLIEVADTDDPVEVGSDTTYEIRVVNTGTKTETNIEVVCTLPDQVEFKAAKCSASLHHASEGREVAFEPLSKLAPRADVVYRVQVRGKAPGDVRFRVRVRADGLTEPVLREECTRFYNDDALVK